MSRTANEGFFDYDDKDMAELTARCVLGGAPQYLVSLYQLANEAPRGLNSTDDPPGRPSVELDLEESREMLACALIDDAAVLLARAVWHPWLSVLFGVVAPEGARPDHPRFPVSGLPERHDDMGAF